MKREIKFRAWSKNAKRMLPDMGVEWCIFGGILSLRNGFILDYEVMQYTGLKDVKKVEAYHKDIIKFFAQTYVIEWSFEMWGYYDEDQKWIPLYKIRDAFEIIGNEHENPELL